jgi:hypothetical protein
MKATAELLRPEEADLHRNSFDLSIKSREISVPIYAAPDDNTVGVARIHMTDKSMVIEMEFDVCIFTAASIDYRDGLPSHITLR